MEKAVTAGRTEMIERLEEERIGFTGCANVAIVYWQNTILEWLVETSRDTGSLRQAIEYANLNVIAILLGHGESPTPDDVTTALDQNMNDLVIGWIKKGVSYQFDTIIKHGTREMKKEAIKKDTQNGLISCLMSVPFDVSLCEYAIQKGAQTDSISRRYLSKDAKVYIRKYQTCLVI